jgi:hypothetical protein
LISLLPSFIFGKKQKPNNRIPLRTAETVPRVTVIHQERWYTNADLEDNACIAVSENGYSNDELGLRWLEHFDKFTAPCTWGSYWLLLLDGYGSHCTHEFIKFCTERNIIPFVLPPHTTHLLQPLDVMVFQPYKHYHAEAIDAATRTGCSDFNKLEFLAAITSIRKKALKSTTIKSAFRQTGLIPYNTEIVLNRLTEKEEKIEPWSDLEGEDSEEEDPFTPLGGPSTPLPIKHQVKITTPLTVQSLKQATDILLARVAIEDSESPGTPSRATKHRLLKLIIKGSLVQAQMGAQAVQDLNRTNAAQNACSIRQVSYPTFKTHFKNGDSYQVMTQAIRQESLLTTLHPLPAGRRIMGGQGKSQRHLGRGNPG